MTREGIEVQDKAKDFSTLELKLVSDYAPYDHQQAALDAWIKAGRRGVAELPTGAGKTLVAYLAMQATPRTTLVVVPTLDLMHQWYVGLEAAYPAADIGLLGGSSKDEIPILVATYDSAAIYAERLGNRYGLLIFDECHHLPADFTRVIAELSLAPYRLGLSATLERGDGKHDDLETLIGPVILSRTPQELSGHALAEHKVVQIKVELSEEERARYDECTRQRNSFLQQKNIFLGSLEGWQRFVGESARSKEGHAAMLAHREARSIAFGTEGKLRVLLELLQKHASYRVLIFTDDNAMVYRVSQTYLIPAITHQTKVKERHSTLVKFKAGIYPRVVTSRVLNEGVRRCPRRTSPSSCPAPEPRESTCSGSAASSARGKENLRCCTKSWPRTPARRGCRNGVGGTASSSTERTSHTGYETPTYSGRFEFRGPVVLPSELLMQRYQGEEIVPKRLELSKTTLATACDLIQVFCPCLGQARHVLDTELQLLEGEETDYRVKRGLAPPPRLRLRHLRDSQSARARSVERKSFRTRGRTTTRCRSRGEGY